LHLEVQNEAFTAFTKISLFQIKRSNLKLQAWLKTRQES